MELLKDKIVNEGYWVGEGILKVDSFLNHQIDIELLDKIGAEIAKIYEGEKIDKVLTAESSGIAIACAAARHLGNLRTVFAKKNKPITMKEDAYQAQGMSFTKGNFNTYVVSKRFLDKGDRVVIIDDFLARGESGSALCEIVKQAGGEIVGYTAAIEKRNQGGYDKISNMGVKVQSLAVLGDCNMETGEINFL